MPTSPDTLLRRVRLGEGQAPRTLRYVGIDDWAWRKGQRYGTIVIDLEKSDVVDLLPDRDAETVKAWFNAHPGVEWVSRDRWSAYALAASEAAPQAQQVADRWHLLKNVREAVERVFERHLPVIAKALKPADPEPEATADASPDEHSDASTVAEVTLPKAAVRSPRQEAASAKRQRRVEQFERVHELHRQGTSIRQVARDLAISRKMVRRYLRCEQCPDCRSRRVRRSKIDGYRDWIDARVAEGRINGSELHRELLSKGLRVASVTVRRYLTKRLGRQDASSGERGETIATPNSIAETALLRLDTSF